MMGAFRHISDRVGGGVGGLGGLRGDHHLIHIVTKLTSGVCELDLGISESFLRKLELGRGDACFADDDDIVLRTPRTICAHAHPPTPRSGL